jgi:hypothetical protein
MHSPSITGTCIAAHYLKPFSFAAFSLSAAFSRARFIRASYSAIEYTLIALCDQSSRTSWFSKLSALRKSVSRLRNVANRRRAGPNEVNPGFHLVLAR